MIYTHCLTAKEKWMKNQCASVEELENVDQSRKCEKVKEITKKKKSNNNIAIEKKDGTVVMEEEVQERDRSISGGEGPIIMRNEVESAGHVTKDEGR